MDGGELWLSILLGVGLGLVYVAVSFLSNKRALRSEERFLIIVGATMIVRVFVALIILVGIVLLLPVTLTAFLGSFFVVFVIGLGFEVWYLQTYGPVSAERDHTE